MHEPLYPLIYNNDWHLHTSLKGHTASKEAILLCKMNKRANCLLNTLVVI